MIQRRSSKATVKCSYTNHLTNCYPPSPNIRRWLIIITNCYHPSPLIIICKYPIFYLYIIIVNIIIFHFRLINCKFFNELFSSITLIKWIFKLNLLDEFYLFSKLSILSSSTEFLLPVGFQTLDYSSNSVFAKKIFILI